MQVQGTKQFGIKSTDSTPSEAVPTCVLICCDSGRARFRQSQTDRAVYRPSELVTAINRQHTTSVSSAGQKLEHRALTGNLDVRISLNVPETESIFSGFRQFNFGSSPGTLRLTGQYRWRHPGGLRHFLGGIASLPLRSCPTTQPWSTQCRRETCCVTSSMLSIATSQILPTSSGGIPGAGIRTMTSPNGLRMTPLRRAANVT